MNHVYNISCISNIGNYRKNNEDRIFINKSAAALDNNFNHESKYIFNDPFVSGISDGMGGKPSGDEAAEIIAENICKIYLEKIKEFQNEKNALKEATRCINEMVVNSFPDSGATLAFTAVDYDDKVACLSIGDSRIYLFRNNTLTQISHDHTLLQFQLDAGIISSPDEANPYLKNGLTQFIGIPEDEMIIDPYITFFKAEKDDIILICSDGLTSSLSDEAIKNILNSNHKNSDSAKLLINEALKNEGKDNISLLLTKVC